MPIFRREWVLHVRRDCHPVVHPQSFRCFFGIIDSKLKYRSFRPLRDKSHIRLPLLNRHPRAVYVAWLGMKSRTSFFLICWPTAHMSPGQTQSHARLVSFLGSLVGLSCWKGSFRCGRLVRHRFGYCKKFSVASPSSTNFASLSLPQSSPSTRLTETHKTVHLVDSASLHGFEKTIKKKKQK